MSIILKQIWVTSHLSKYGNSSKYWSHRPPLSHLFHWPRRLRLRRPPWFSCPRPRRRTPPQTTPRRRFP